MSKAVEKRISNRRFGDDLYFAVDSQFIICYIEARSNWHCIMFSRVESLYGTVEISKNKPKNRHTKSSRNHEDRSFLPNYGTGPLDSVHLMTILPFCRYNMKISGWHCRLQASKSMNIALELYQRCAKLMIEFVVWLSSPKPIRTRDCPLARVTPADTICFAHHKLNRHEGRAHRRELRRVSLPNENHKTYASDSLGWAFSRAGLSPTRLCFYLDPCPLFPWTGKFMLVKVFAEHSIVLVRAVPLSTLDTEITQMLVSLQG